MKNFFLKSKGDYINGKFIKDRSHKESQQEIVSPADLDDRVFQFSSYPAHVEPACVFAARAYSSWSRLSQERRKACLRKLIRIYREKKEEIAVLISRETGKPLWESRKEAQSLSQKVDITLQEALPLVRDSFLFSSGKEGTKGKVIYRSRGVFLVLGPFNFPAHLPNGHIIPALAFRQYSYL